MYHMKVIRSHPFNRLAMNIISIFLADVSLVVKLGRLNLPVIDSGMPRLQVHPHSGARHEGFWGPETDMAGGPHNTCPLVEDQLIGLKIEIPALKKSVAIGMNQVSPVIETDVVCQNRNLAGIRGTGRSSFRSEGVERTDDETRQENQQDRGKESGELPPGKNAELCHDGADTEVRSPACRGESSPASHFWTPATR